MPGTDPSIVHFAAVLLFALGAVGFVARRDLLVMALSAGLMFLALALALGAFGAQHRSPGGPVLALLVLTVGTLLGTLLGTAAYAARRHYGTCDPSAWQRLHHSTLLAAEDATPALPGTAPPEPPLDTTGAG